MKLLPWASQYHLSPPRQRTLLPSAIHTRSPRHPREVAPRFARGPAMRAPMGRCRDLFAFPSANAASDPGPCPGGASGNVLCRRLCGQGAQRRLAGTDELTGRVSRRRRRLGARRCNCTMVRAWCERRAPHFFDGGTAKCEERTPAAGGRRASGGHGRRHRTRPRRPGLPTGAARDLRRRGAPDTPGR